MKSIPKTRQAPVLRADFSDERVWQMICAAIQKPIGRARAYVDFVNDPAYEGIAAKQVLSLIPQDMSHTFIFIVDHFAMSHQEHPILVMDLFDEPGRTFRAIPSKICSIENNLSIANMDFTNFADATDKEGIFRGFPRSRHDT